MKIIQGNNPDVWKMIFDEEFGGAITESVLYRYRSFEDRTVLCISCQSGCKVGCTFCGTGKNFIRNLSSLEIVQQVVLSLRSVNIIDEKTNFTIDPPKKFQIMFMSMGEPFHNYVNLRNSICILSECFPTASLLISTSAPKADDHYKDFIHLSKRIDKLGLQFSIHKSTDWERNQIIPFKNKMKLAELRDYGIEWWKETNRKPYCNYCIDGDNSMDIDFTNLRNLFPPNVFCFTFSVVCSYDETMKDSGYRNLSEIRRFESLFIDHGYDTRVFDPAGQDDIGGGCGQLWYVQDWLKNRSNEKNCVD